MPAEKHGPLHGVTVIDLTSFIFGPYATQTLGDLGAEVIKIEAPEGDKQRFGLKQNKSKNMGSTFMMLNRNKKSVTLDLKVEADREKLRALLPTAQVFIHNVRTSAMNQLGFGYEQVAAINPAMVYVHCVGYGSDGPYGGRQAFDDLVQAASGGADMILDAAGASTMRMFPSYVADKVSGLHALYATLAALFHRERTGEGQFVEVPMLESYTSFLMVEHLYGAAFEPSVGHVGSTPALAPDRACFRTRDGWIATMPSGKEGADNFMKLGGIADFYNSEEFVTAKTSREKVALYNVAMRQAAAMHTTEAWMELGERHRIPIMRANTMDNVLEDPHLKAVGFFEVLPHETEGEWRSMKPPIRFSKTPASVRGNPQKPGASNAAVLGKIKTKAAE
ncbi:MAG TPA: CoA transferase [Rhizomicrobium sp.]|jgi:crotonobetainyl-CoA:carnitine CoA-transferase CaiB-like acyl-CoA transferase|nr:CoA transferase [Rhizomicrobium sp.]